jgi:Protein of unknown function (DUF2568)
MQAANLGLRFLLELCALAAVGYWGLHHHGGVAQFVLGIGGPLLVAVVWGLFLSPKATVSIPSPARLTLELVVFAVRSRPWPLRAPKSSRPCLQRSTSRTAY